MRKTILVTGATGGIGVAVVAALADGGYRVIAAARSEERLAELRAEHAEVETVAFGLGADLPPALADLERLDGVVHAAGIAEVASVEDTPHALWDETMTANVVGPADLTRALLGPLRAASGHVVFINLAPGMRAVPNWSAYVASKAALRELADSLREEEDRHGIRVTTIYPGGVATELLRKVRAQFGRPYDPEASVRPATLAKLVRTVLEFPADAHVTEVSLRPAPTGG
jgi:NADP-dependent 3-hydroxy acid dehydrogenase YdfG